MRSLIDYIKESLDRDELQFKLDTWMRARPEENKYWEEACKSWNERRQLDNDAVKRFMDNTDVRGFVDFMNAEVSTDGVHSDDFETIRNIITNL